MDADNVNALLNGSRNGQRDSEPGKPAPHVTTFSSVLNGYAKLYSYRYDEALRASTNDALCMRRDPYMTALVNERAMPTARRKWQLEVDDDKDPWQKEVKEGLTKVVKAISRYVRFRLYLTKGALWFGRYGSQGVWTRKDLSGESLWTFDRHKPVNGDKIQFQWDGTPAVMVGMGGMSYPKDSLIFGDRAPLLKLHRPEWRRQFVIHTHEVDDADYFEGEMAGAVNGIGLRSQIYWAWWLRDEMLSWALNFMQKVGTLGILIFWYETGNKEAKSKAEENAQAVSTRSVLVMPRPMGKDTGTWGVEQIAPNTGGIETLKAMIQDYFENHMERLIIGQTLSGGTEGSGLGGTGVASLHQDTKFQLLAFDAENLDETLTTDLIDVAKRLNYPWADFPCRHKSILPDPEREAKLTGLTTIWDKVPVRTSDLYEAADAKEPEPGDDTVGGPEVAPPGGGPLGGLLGGGTGGALGGLLDGDDAGGAPLGGVLDGDDDDAWDEPLGGLLDGSPLGGLLTYAATIERASDGRFGTVAGHHDKGHAKGAEKGGRPDRSDRSPSRPPADAPDAEPTLRAIRAALPPEVRTDRGLTTKTMRVAAKLYVRLFTRVADLGFLVHTYAPDILDTAEDYESMAKGKSATGQPVGAATGNDPIYDSIGVPGYVVLGLVPKIAGAVAGYLSKRKGDDEYAVKPVKYAAGEDAEDAASGVVKLWEVIFEELGIDAPIPDAGTVREYMAAKRSTTPETYAGQWVTIGAQSGPDGKKHGGTPCYIEGGKITRGPKHMVGRSPNELGGKPVSPAAAPKPAQQSPSRPAAPPAPQPPAVQPSSPRALSGAEAAKRAAAGLVPFPVRPTYFNPDKYDRFMQAAIAKMPDTQIDTDTLTAGQPKIDPAKVAALRGGKLPEKVEGGTPAIVFQMEDGERLIVEGHHRATAAAIDGKPLMAKVFYLDAKGGISDKPPKPEAYAADPERAEDGRFGTVAGQHGEGKPKGKPSGSRPARPVNAKGQPVNREVLREAMDNPETAADVRAKLPEGEKKKLDALLAKMRSDRRAKRESHRVSKAADLAEETGKVIRGNAEHLKRAGLYDAADAVQKAMLSVQHTADKRSAVGAVREADKALRGLSKAFRAVDQKAVEVIADDERFSGLSKRNRARLKPAIKRVIADMRDQAGAGPSLEDAGGPDATRVSLLSDLRDVFDQLADPGGHVEDLAEGLGIPESLDIADYYDWEGDSEPEDSPEYDKNYRDYKRLVHAAVADHYGLSQGDDAPEKYDAAFEAKHRRADDGEFGKGGGKGGGEAKAAPKPTPAHPRDADLAGAKVEPLTGTGAVSEAGGGLNKVTAKDGRAYVHKAGRSGEMAREAAVSELAALSGVPSPAAAVAEIGGKSGLLSSFVDGKRADQDKEGFAKAISADPAAATRMALHNFLVGAQDKSSSNYMVADGTVVSIDHGEALGSHSPDDSRTGLDQDAVLAHMETAGIGFDPEVVREMAGKADALVAHLKTKGMAKEAKGVADRAAILKKLAADAEPSEAKLRALLGSPQTYAAILPPPRSWLARTFGPKPDPVVTYEAVHAPTGGVTVGEKSFAGGEFIPGKVMAKATAAENAAVRGKGGDSEGKPEPKADKKAAPKANNSGGPAEKKEHAAAKKQAAAKIEAAPVPTPDRVEFNRSRMAAFREAAAAARAAGTKVPQQREFLDLRGNTTQRKARRKKLFEEFGGTERGYVVCHGTGLKMHWSEDPDENPKGLPVFEEGKVFTAEQGGRYNMENLLPESFAWNRSRNNEAVRPENLT